MYGLEIAEDVVKLFKKMEKKDRIQLESINKKIALILSDPSQFKPLRHPMEGLRRVHVGSFVLIYEVIESSKTVRIVAYKHHDQAYL